MIEHFDPLKGEMLRILDETGTGRSRTSNPRLADGELRRIYRAHGDDPHRGHQSLQPPAPGPHWAHYAQSRGHEACQIGTAFALEPRTTGSSPTSGTSGCIITLGYPLALYYHYWMGHEAGLRTPDGLNIFPLAIPVASQIPHAVGAGMAANIRKLAARRR